MGKSGKQSNGQMFIGEYLHSIDDKNRISLPRDFRKELSGQVVLTRGLDTSLFLFSETEWQIISEKIAQLGFGNARSRGISRFLLSGAQKISVDKAGRILLPEHLKEFATIDQKVIFAGVYNRIELWSEPNWRSYQKKIQKSADDLAEHLGDVGMI